MHNIYYHELNLKSQGAVDSDFLPETVSSITDSNTLYILALAHPGACASHFSGHKRWTACELTHYQAWGCGRPFWPGNASMKNDKLLSQLMLISGKRDKKHIQQCGNLDWFNMVQVTFHQFLDKLFGVLVLTISFLELQHGYLNRNHQQVIYNLKRKNTRKLFTITNVQCATQWQWCTDQSVVHPHSVGIFLQRLSMKGLDWSSMPWAFGT